MSDKVALLLFQFHIGTIKRPLPLCKPILIVNFNSTLVRLKAKFLSGVGGAIGISIPHWYD